MLLLMKARATRLSTITPALTVLLGVLVVLVARWGPDWPAQEFRAWVAAHDGLVAWTSRWYGGQALPGYSVLYPLVAGPLGAGLTGLLSTGVSAWAATSLAPSSGQRVRARWFAVAVAVSLMQSLLIGQVPYLMGTAFALLAVRSVLRNDHGAWTTVFATACSLSSPLAGVSLLLAVPSLLAARGWRRTSLLSFSMIGIAVPTLVGGADGPFPFLATSFAGVALFCAAAFLLGGRERPGLRALALGYLLVAIAAFVVPNPIGGNIARPGKLLAMPLAVRLIEVPRQLVRRVVAAVAVVLAVAWPSLAFTSAILRGATDSSQHAAYYAGLIGYLDSQRPASGRVEIPFTREHWEALWVAQTVPIARGWERQTDLLYNGVLYHPLSARRYRTWLDANAVSLVALSRAPIDYGGRAEAALLAHPLSYLRPVWHDANWQVWRVSAAAPLIAGDATITRSTTSSLELRFTGAGTAILKIHASRLWHVTGQLGCVGTTAGGWLRVTSSRQGRVDLAADISRQLVKGTPTC